jgi:Protein of unknown function (DUF2752)
VSESHQAGLTVAPRLRLMARPGPPLGLIFAGIGLLATLAIGLLGLDHLGVSFCYVKTLTGLPCPTCGSTRVLGRLFAGDLAGALAMNPLAALAALGVVAWGAADAALLPRKRALCVAVAPPLGRALRVAAALAILANWAYLVLAGR